MHVAVVPEFPIGLMTGGMQVQAEELVYALTRYGTGVTAELFSWSERKPLPDVYHFVGLQPSLYPVIDLIREAGKRYVITMIAGVPRGDKHRIWAARMRFLLKTWVLRKNQRHMALHNADRIVVVNRPQADLLRGIFGIRREAFVVIPHGVQEHYFGCSPDLWHGQYGRLPFILSVGAVQERKGQLLLVNVCNRLEIPCVLVGDVLPGQRQYGQRVSAAIEINQKFGGRWLQSVQNENPIIASAYAACRLFVLLSSCETQPISVLQAMAAAKPVLLLKAPYSREAPFNTLPQVDIAEADEISRMILQQWSHGKPSSLPQAFGWPAVAHDFCATYAQVVGRDRPSVVNSISSGK